MNKFYAMFRQGATVIVVIILAIAAFWLVGRQVQPGSQPTAQDTDRPTPPPATPQPTIPPTPLPTETPTATPTATASPNPTHTPFTPEVVLGKITIITLPPPEPTATPLGRGPDAVVTLVSDAPLLSAEVLALMQVQENNKVWVEAWPAPNELMVGVGYRPHKTYWSVSIDKAEARQVGPPSNSLTDAAAEELRQFNDYVDYVQVSPDKQWVAWEFGQILLVKRLGTDEPPIDLLGVQYQDAQGGSGTLVWSPQSDRLAYVVDNGHQSRYEIRLSDPLGQQTTVIPLSDTRIYHLAWSPDGQYLAFEMLEEPQSGTNHLYVVRRDGSGLTQLTDHGHVNGPIVWSPTGETIVYTNRVDRRPWVARLSR